MRVCVGECVCVSLCFLQSAFTVDKACRVREMTKPWQRGREDRRSEWQAGVSDGERWRESEPVRGRERVCEHSPAEARRREEESESRRPAPTEWAASLLRTLFRPSPLSCTQEDTTQWLRLRFFLKTLCFKGESSSARGDKLIPEWILKHLWALILDVEQVDAEESGWELRVWKRGSNCENYFPCMLLVSVSKHHGMHHQRGSVGGAALHPGEELWLHQGSVGARGWGGGGGGGGDAESEGISTVDSHHSSGRLI